jgi:hypothetical protein
MAQAGTNQYTQEAVEEQGVEQFVFDLLLLIKLTHQQVGQGKT